MRKAVADAPGLDDFLTEQLNELLGYVKAVAWSLIKKMPANYGSDLDELCAIGNEALLRSLQSWYGYCDDRGHSDTQRADYCRARALQRIRGAMQDRLRQDDWLTRTERRDVALIREAENLHGNLPAAELARLTGLSSDKVHKVRLAMASKPLTLDMGPRDESGWDGGLDDHYDPAGAETTESAVHARELLTAGVDALTRQDELVRVVVALHYFLEWSLTEIADVLGLSEPRVRALRAEGEQAAHRAMLEAATETLAPPASEVGKAEGARLR